MTVAEYQQAQNDIAEIKAQIAQLRDVVAKGVPAVREIYGADLPTPEPLPEAGASYPNVGALQFQQGKMMAGVEAAKKAVMPTTEALGAIRGNPEDQGETRRDIAKKLVEILTMGAGEAPDSTANAIANLGSGTAALIATAPAMLPLTVEQSVADGVERGNPLAPATDMAQAIGQTFQRQVTGEAGGVTRGEAWSKTPVEEAFNLATPLLAGLGIAKARTPKIKSIKEARAAINDIGKPKVDVPEVVQEPIRSEMPKVEQPTSAAEVVEKAGSMNETAHAKPVKTIYHGTDKEFSDFDINKAQDGTIWFTDNKSKIDAGEVSAAGKGRIVERQIDESKLKLGGWDETDKFSTDELIAQGYDGLKLVDDDQTTYQIFHPEKLTKPTQPTTATEVVAKAKPNAVTQGVKQLTPDELTAAQAKLREKFKPMDEAIETSTPPVVKAKKDTPITDTKQLSQRYDDLQKQIDALEDNPNASSRDLDELYRQRDAVGDREFAIFKNDLLNIAQRYGLDGATANRVIKNVYGLDTPLTGLNRVTNEMRSLLTNRDKVRQSIFNELMNRPNAKGVSLSNVESMGSVKGASNKVNDIASGIERDIYDNLIGADSRAGKISTEPTPPVTTPDAGATPAQSTKPVEKVQAPQTISEGVGQPKPSNAVSYNKPTLKTQKATLEIGYAGWRNGFRISTPEGAEVSGFINDVDFLNKPSSITRGDIFSVKVPEQLRRSGVATSLVDDAIALMKANGVKSVKMTIPNRSYGKPFVESLSKRGLIGDVIGESGTGTKEFIIKSADDIQQRAGKISTEQPTATVQDAAVRPAQPTNATPNVAEKLAKSLRNQFKRDVADKDFQPYEKLKVLDDRKYRGELYDSNDNYIGDVYKDDDGFFTVYRIKDSQVTIKTGKPTADAELPIKFMKDDLVGGGGIDLGYTSVKKYKFKIDPDVIDDPITPDLAAKYGKPTTAEAVVKKAGENELSRGVLFRDMPEDKLKAINADRTMQESHKWAHKVGEQVEYVHDKHGVVKAIVASSYIENGKPIYHVYPPGKKTSYGYHVTVRENELFKRGESVKSTKSANQPPTELHAGVNPFKIIDDYMTKRKLVNPLGTPEHVLSGKGIVEPFRKAQEAIRNETKARGESLQETLKGIQRGSHEDNALYHRLDDPTAVLNEQEQAVRNYLDDLLTEVNKHREARGQEPVKRRKGYITHLVEEVEKQSREYGDTPMPKRFKFQFELAREGNASHKVSAIEALEVYTKAALKDIYIGDALAETVPKIEAMGDRPLIFKKSVTSEDGKVTNQSFYQFSDAPIITERGYAEAFIKGQMNVPTVGQRALETAFDIKPNTSQHAAMAITARFYQSLLGLAVDSGVKNLTQGINTLAELGVTPTLGGYAKMATPKGLKLARAEHLLEDFNPLLMEGADLPFNTKTARAIGKGFSATLNAPMKVAEFINRGAAFHAAYDVFIKKGMSLEQAHEAARAAVRKTQFSYSKIDTSPALRGPFARVFSQFFSYPLKQSEMMYKWATKPGEQGKLIRYFLYTGMAVVGAKYAGVDMSGVFFDPIKMVDPNSKEGFQLPGSDKRVTIDPKKLGKSGYTPQGFAPSISIPYDFVKSQMSDDESTREYGREKALTSITPGGRYGKKVYDVITESDEKGKRDRLTRENTDKDKTLKLLGFRGTEREAESSRRESVVEVEKKYYATRQKLIDLKISGNEDEFIKVRDEFRDKYPFLYGRLMKGFGDAVKEERKKKGMTTDERFFDNSLRKQIDANL